MGGSDNEASLKDKKGGDKAEKDRRKAEMDRQKVEMDRQKVEMDRQKVEMDRQKVEMDRQKVEMDRQKVERKAEMDRCKVEQKAEVDRRKVEMDKLKAEKKNKEKAEMDRRKVEMDKHKAEKKERDNKEKKDKKNKDKKDESLQPSGTDVSGGPVHGEKVANYDKPSGTPSQPHSQPAHPSHSGETQWFLREPTTEVHGQLPPSYTSPQQPPSRALGDCGTVDPPSGYRIPLGPNSPFPGPDQLGRPPTTEFDSSTGPIFIGSAIFPDSVHPCKITPSLHPPCRVSYGGDELEHHGRFDLLPITQDMEWVLTSNGRIPPGRRPVEGGYESNGEKLYHALGSVQGVQIPGKAGEHLGGASIPFGGSERNLRENYSILCWR